MCVRGFQGHGCSVNPGSFLHHIECHHLRWNPQTGYAVEPDIHNPAGFIRRALVENWVVTPQRMELRSDDPLRMCAANSPISSSIEGF
jgi:hypothetical protein